MAPNLAQTFKIPARALSMSNMLICI